MDANDLVGYLNQCACGQRTLTRSQHDPRGYRCPQCADDAAERRYEDALASLPMPRGFIDLERQRQQIETGHDIGGTSCAEAAAMFPQHTKPNPCAKAHKGVIRWGICDACGQAANYPWGDSIPFPPESDLEP